MCEFTGSSEGVDIGRSVGAQSREEEIVTEVYPLESPKPDSLQSQVFCLKVDGGCPIGSKCRDPSAPPSLRGHQ